MTSDVRRRFDILEKGYLVLLALQVGVMVSRGLRNELGPLLPGFALLAMVTALALPTLRRIADDPHNRPAAPWLLALRGGGLAILTLATVVATFHAILPRASTDVVAQALIPMMWAVIALKGAAVGKLRPGGPLGLRIPWTLQSRQAWDNAHRLLGRILFVGGLLGLAIGFAAPPQVSFVAWLGVVATALALAVAVSWRTWRDDPERQAAR